MVEIAKIPGNYNPCLNCGTITRADMLLCSKCMSNLVNSLTAITNHYRRTYEHVLEEVGRQDIKKATDMRLTEDKLHPFVNKQTLIVDIETEIAFASLVSMVNAHATNHGRLVEK